MSEQEEKRVGEVLTAREFSDFKAVFKIYGRVLMLDSPFSFLLTEADHIKSTAQKHLDSLDKNIYNLETRQIIESEDNNKKI